MFQTAGGRRKASGETKYSSHPQQPGLPGREKPRRNRVGGLPTRGLIARDLEIIKSLSNPSMSHPRDYNAPTRKPINSSKERGDHPIKRFYSSIIIGTMVKDDDEAIACKT